MVWVIGVVGLQRGVVSGEVRPRRDPGRAASAVPAAAVPRRAVTTSKK